MKKYLLLFSLFFCFALQSYASIKVSPTMIEIDSKNSKSNYVTSSFNVQAGKDEIVRYKVYPEYFQITNQGKMDIQGQKVADDSLVNNIKFVPSEFTLSNGRVQKVRLTISDFKKLPDGESRLVLFLEDVKAKEVNLPNNYKNVSTRLLLKTRVGVPIYFDNGHVEKKGIIDFLQVQQNGENLVCNMKINSVGNSKLRYTGKAQLIKGKQLITEYDIQKGVVGRNNFLITQNLLPIRDVKEHGEYKLRMILNYKDANNKNKNILKETTFNINQSEMVI